MAAASGLGSAGQAAQRNHSFSFDIPACQNGTIDFGNAYWTGHYAGGYIAFRVWIVPWDFGGWDVQSAQPTNWLVESADPSQTFYIDVGQYNLGEGNSFGIVYEAWWGDASGTWDSSTQSFFTPDHYNVIYGGTVLRPDFCV